MEYCSHIWAGSGSSSLLDRVESKAKRLINCPLLSNSLDPYLCDVTLAHYLFSIGTTIDLSHSPQLLRPRCTRGALLSHEFCVDVGNPRLARCGASFFPATSVLWNSLPSSIFPPVFDLSLFKTSVCAHLRDMR